MKAGAFTVMRVSVGAVFLVFGIGKFQHDYWARTIETMDVFQHLPWSPAISVLLIGTTEVAVGVLLLVGLWTRWAAGIAMFQLAAILFLLSFQETRDFGLWGAAFYMMIAPQPAWGLDALIQKRRNRKPS